MTAGSRGAPAPPRALYAIFLRAGILVSLVSPEAPESAVSPEPRDQTDPVRVALARVAALDQPMIACAPLYPPELLFHAFGLFPVVPWGITSDLETAPAHLQVYTCSVARQFLEFAVSRGADLLDGLFYYNACDTLRNLPEIVARAQVKSAAGASLPWFHLHVPQVPPAQANARAYLREGVAALVQALETTYDVIFSGEAFQRAATRAQASREQVHALQALVVDGKLSFARFATTVARAALEPLAGRADFLQARRDAATQSAPAVPEGAPRVILSGIEVPSPELLARVARAGLHIVADDIAALSRGLGPLPAPTTDPGTYYEHFYFNHLPCTTLLFTADKRLAYLREMVATSRAEAILFLGEKYCEHEYFEFPYLRQALERDGTRALQLELADPGARDLDRLQTRVEAFAEVLHAKEA